ncbi:ABC transporter substrate-binding protein [Meiothermus granaticius]|uniref:Putative ABC transporter-binding protein n=1 Tax=Meiothermus granaticius NBRC 107808 TaxID=1227551 RepID=A0A399F8K9_9DEIN|nr:ABC transporter substrate-binding protein [Meiothermus granaticius]RIH91599.1 putative ABC transporter-binding protein [Meiothermus granaticius NBRC 107808]
MKHPWLVLAALTALGAGLGQAQVQVYPQKWTVAKPGEAKRGGVLRTSVISDFRTFNPFITAEAGNVPDTISGLHGLVQRDPSNGEWIPDMATSWTISPNKLEITFKIRRGMKWSDGQAITADDWVTTFKIHTDEKVGSNSYDSFFIDGKPVKVSKVDDYTLKITYPKTDAEAFAVASYTPWPDHIFGPVYQKEGAEGIKKMWGLNAKVSDIVSPGPWVIGSYTPGERLVLKRNPYFGEWNKDEAGNPLPYLDGQEILIVKDTNAQLAAFLSGQIDLYSPSTVDQISQVRKAVQDNKLDATIKVNISPNATSQFIVFDWNKKSDPFKQELFRSAKFRQAMSHLVNRQAVIDVVYGGFGTPTYTSIYPVLKDWVNPAAPKYDFDPKKATQLLTELGFTKKDNEGYLVNAQGKRLEFNLATNAGNNQREQMARLFADEAKKVGVKVNFNPIDFNTLVGQLQSKGDDRPWDAILIGLSGGGLDWPFGSNVVPCTGSLHMYNTSGKCIDPRETQLSALYSRGRTELDLAKRKEIGNQMQVIEAQLQPIVYIAGPNYHPAWNNRVGGQFPDKLINALYGSRTTELTYIAK